LIAALALLLQVASPIWVAAALLGAAPPFDTPLCSEHIPDGGDQRAPHHAKMIACPLCAIVGHAFYAPAAAAIVLRRPSKAVFIIHTAYQIAAPRGPPSFAPNARAPPISL
jgi:hypothetical protein